MTNYFLSFCYRLGIPPTPWMLHNPFKIYEYFQVTGPVDLRPTDIVLDLGCGQGFWAAALAKKCRKVVGVDISKDAIRKARHYTRNSPLKNRLEFHAGRLEDLNLDQESFDHIFSFCVLEHIENLPVVLQEAKRLLRPGGHLHVSVDSLATIADPVLLEKHRSDHYVVQYFTADSICAELSRAGFAVQTVSPILCGEYARNEFERRIQGESYHFGWFERRAQVKRLQAEDQKTKSDAGIMIIVHAKNLQEVA